MSILKYSESTVMDVCMVQLLSGYSKTPRNKKWSNMMIEISTKDAYHILIFNSKNSKAALMLTVEEW